MVEVDFGTLHYVPLVSEPISNKGAHNGRIGLIPVICISGQFLNDLRIRMKCPESVKLTLHGGVMMADALD